MALSEKIGGPYTKPEQENRRKEVFRLYFEKSYPATKIADMLNVNRNTVNEDIKHLYSEIAAELDSFDVGTLALKQYQKMEIQRDRLVDSLDKVERVQDRIAIEKMIDEIDNRITKLVSNIVSKPNKYEIQENEVNEIIRHIVLNGDVEKIMEFSEEDFLYETINLKKCDLPKAKECFKKTEDLGMTLCKKFGSIPFTYNLIKFARMRQILSEKELEPVYEKIKENMNLKLIEDMRNERFKKKFGPMERWSDEIWEKYEDENYDIE